MTDYLKIGPYNMPAGTPADTKEWARLYWVEQGKYDLAVRQRYADSMWYVTRGCSPEMVILYGPIESLDTIELLLHMEGGKT